MAQAARPLALALQLRPGPGQLPLAEAWLPACWCAGQEWQRGWLGPKAPRAVAACGVARRRALQARRIEGSEWLEGGRQGAVQCSILGPETCLRWTAHEALQLHTAAASQQRRPPPPALGGLAWEAWRLATRQVRPSKARWSTGRWACSSLTALGPASLGRPTAAPAPAAQPESAGGPRTAGSNRQSGGRGSLLHRRRAWARSAGG